MAALAGFENMRWGLEVFQRKESWAAQWESIWQINESRSAPFGKIGYVLSTGESVALSIRYAGGQHQTPTHPTTHRQTFSIEQQPFSKGIFSLDMWRIRGRMRINGHFCYAYTFALPLQGKRTRLPTDFHDSEARSELAFFTKWVYLFNG